MSGMDRLTELLPCPFCGGEAKRIMLTERDGAENEGGDVITCNSCGASSHVEFGRKENLVAAWNRRASQAAPAHEDDLAVDQFAATMKAKLAKKRNDGRGGWSGLECSEETLSRMLRDHVAKGDPVDVANFAMMLHQRGERIGQAAPADDSYRQRIKALAGLIKHRNNDGKGERSLFDHVKELVELEKAAPAPSDGLREAWIAGRDAAASVVAEGWAENRYQEEIDAALIALTPPAVLTPAPAQEGDRTLYEPYPGAFDHILGKDPRHD